jgi:glycosyltransferase involved in cell wall biosynthesis
MSGGTRSYEMARRLAAAGHEVHMITTDRSGISGRNWYITSEMGIQIHWLPVPYSNNMSYSERIYAFLRFATGAAHYASQIKSDVVFATSTPLTIAIPAVYVARKQRIPLVFEVRDLWPELPIAVGALKGPMIPPAQWLEQFAYRNSSQIVALSPGMKEGITRSGYPPDHVHVIPNSADLDMFSVQAGEGISFRRKFDWLQNRPLVVYTGTLGRINGVDYLARLAAVTRTIAPDIRFLVVGDGAERQRVVDTAKQYRVYEENFFMMPPLPKAQIPAVLSAADMATSLVIDLPQLWDNSANKFFDALASGTPIAINHLGWQAKLLEENGAGVVLDRRDIDQATLKLLDFINDQKRLKDAGISARRLAEEMFSRDKLAKQLEQVLLLAVRNFR